MRKALLAAALLTTSLATTPTFAQSTTPPSDTSTSRPSDTPRSDTRAKTSPSDDQVFAMLITQHHKDGIAMAEAEIANGSREDVKAAARRMLADQQRDVAKLEPFTKPAKGGEQMELPPRDPELERRMAQLRASKGADADRLFLELMIAHHALGVMMAQAAAPHLTNTELTSFARDMFGKQARDIGELQRLRETSQPARK